MLGMLLFLVSSFGADLTVDMLDVGQGDAILVRTEGFAALIDAGPRDADTEAQLKALGVTHLDVVVATHPHADHIGRMPQVLQTFSVGQYVDNGMSHTTKNYERLMAAVEATEVPHRKATNGMTFPFGDEAVFTVLFPGETLLRGTRSDLNSNSVVLRLDHGESSFLFTGDAEAPTESHLLRSQLGDIDVLKVAHHGSGHSSTLPFLETLRPQAALISCGEDNRYHHPYPQALKRLRSVGSLIYRTDLSGNIRALSDGNKIEIFEGSIPELDAVHIVPWPDPEPKTGPVRAPRSDPDGAEVPPSSPARRLSRRAYFAELDATGVELDLTSRRALWRAYRKAWKLAHRMERQARKSASADFVKEDSEG